MSSLRVQYSPRFKNMRNSISLLWLQVHVHALAVVGKCVAALLVTLVWIGCSKPPEFQVKPDVQDAGTFTQYKLVVDGVPMGPWPVGQPHQFSAHGHKGDTPREMLPHVEASVLYVCGWQPVAVELSPPSESALE